MIKGFNQKGQFLIELLIAVGLAVVLIGSLMSLSNANNRRAVQARQANQASRLAQEGMELVRNIAKINDPQAVVPDTAADRSSWSGMFETDLSGPTTYTLHRRDGTDCDTDPISQSWCLDNPGDSDSDREIDRDGTTYTREVNIVDDAALSSCNTTGSPPVDYKEAKQVTVRVSWDSPSGAQERSVISCFTNK